MGKTSHRGTLKKEKKPFKSKHSTKGQLKNVNKGKVEKTSGNGIKLKQLSKIDRKNQARQLKDNKILETKLTRKIFEGSNGVEKIVTIIPLTDDLSASEIIEKLLLSIEEPSNDFQVPSITNIKVNRFRSNLKVIIPDPTNLLSILDATKVSDFTIFGISATSEVDPEYGESILRAVIAQGIGSVIGVLPNLVTSYPKRNLQLDIRQSLTSFFKHFFPAEEKLFALEIETECTNCIRTICQKFPKSVNWRDNRGYMIADNISYEENLLVVEGSVRGIGFNTNNLVHLHGHGDFQINHIEKISRDEMNDIIEPNENQETLEELNPEELEMEEDYFEYNDDDMGIRMDGKNYFNDGPQQPQRRFKLPKGTSEYQSKWLLDDVLEGVSDTESIDENEEEPNMEILDEMRDDIEEEEDTEEEDGDMFVDLTPEEEQRQLESYRSQIKDDLEFPDEIELKPTDSAKEVMKKYRGIKSLANCDWEVDEADEEAPEEWNRLLRISNYKSTKNKVVKDTIKNCQVNMGNKIRMFIRAPTLNIDTSKPFVVYGLLEHEHKLGVINFSFQNWEGFEESIPSNEPIIAQYGPRRQIINPLFNQATNNPNNVHKLERFHHQGNVSIATCIGPILFNNAPTIFFKQLEDGSLKLIGQGTFLNCDHSRIVVERSILTGHPVKIHKNVVTVRYMFFNAQDINWFKAVPLYTGSGRSGFIKESLGTHGYFKANFDGKLSAQDVVAMNLYKRTWPQRSIMFNQ